MTDRAVAIEMSRAHEVFYRKLGLFTAAVAAQRHADALEAGGSLRLNTYQIDRGATDGCEPFILDSFFGIFSGDEAGTLLMSRDGALRVFMGLTVFLELRREDLLELIDRIDQTEKDLTT